MSDIPEHSPVSPIEGTAWTGTPLSVDAERQSQQQRQNRQSTSTAGTEAAMSHWEAPPVPPIPVDTVQEAWRRRSLKRASCASQLSNFNGVQPQAANDESRHPRPSSSTPSGMNTPKKRQPRVTIQPQDEPDQEEPHWQVATYNPRNWSKGKKWFTTIVSGSTAFACMLASSIVAPGQSDLVSQFQVSPILATFPLSLYVLGLAFGPILSTPCSERFGRKAVYATSLAVSGIFIIAAGLVHQFSTLVVFRFLAGLFGGPILAVGSTSISDMWAPDESALPIALHTTIAFLGLTLGPLTGGYLLTVRYWRWTQYVAIFVVTACLIPVTAMHETSRVVIVHRKQREPLPKLSTKTLLKKALCTPVHMLSTEPITLLFSLYSGFAFAVFYGIFTAFPGVFAKNHGFALDKQGLAFVGMVAGVILGSVWLVINEFFYHRRLTKWQDDRAAEVEKATAVKCRMSRSSKGYAPLGPDSNGSVVNIQPQRLSKDPKRHSLALSSRSKSAVPEPPQEAEKNIKLSVAAADYLNNIPQNEGKRIMPERVFLILIKNPTFSEICTQLESYNLRFDTVQLAKALIDALPKVEDSTEAGAETAAAAAEESRLVQSKSLHRNAAAAALDAGSAEKSMQMSISPTSPSSARQLSTMSMQMPPAEWRLTAALPGSMLVAGGLIMLAWTSRSSINAIAPIVAMGLFACGTLAVCVSCTQYLGDCYRTEHDESALAASHILRYVLGGVFPLFTPPLYGALGTAWATSVLGFVSIALGVVPWLLLVLGPSLRRRSGYRSSI